MQTLPFIDADPSTLRMRCPHCAASRAGDVAARSAGATTPGTAQPPDAAAAAPAQTGMHRQRSIEPARGAAPLRCPILRAALLGSIALVLLVVDMVVLWPLP
ncbi:hypothetical protein [Xanthomonas sp. 4461]|uniref:hypothetical protein n=1 Tax=Xanthomonas sp. 4461 TaxID=3035313 RepID=UPI002169502B|nr:hypothetical protein [Xanthomonas sp. 4461]MCS3807993.1 hypothetical protein [Xanthomonas sp. 4461]